MLAKKGSVAPQSIYLMTGFLYAMTLTRKPYEGDFFIEVSEGFVKFDGLFLWHARASAPCISRMGLVTLVTYVIGE